MNLNQAAQQKDPCTAAKFYADQGISVLPLVGKKPAIAWEDRQQQRASSGLISGWGYRDLFGNVGIVCGQVSSNLIVIDLDGREAVMKWEITWPQYFHTFTVATGSGEGKHVYLRPDVLPATTRACGLPGIGNIELRANGCYVVAPPSIHPETQRPYVVENDCPVLRVRDLQPVVLWLIGLMEAKKPVPQPAPTVKRPVVSGNQRTMRWAEAALTYECGNLRATPGGNQNNQLNRAAYNMGQIVADGHIDRMTVESALLNTALAIGQDEPQSRRTIQSGLEAGLKNPRSLQWRNRSK